MAMLICLSWTPGDFARSPAEVHRGEQAAAGQADHSGGPAQESAGHQPHTGHWSVQPFKGSNRGVVSQSCCKQID